MLQGQKSCESRSQTYTSYKLTPGLTHTLTLIQHSMKFKQLRDAPSLRQLEHNSQINFRGLNTSILYSDVTSCLQ
jgi:hypothetical protein